MAYMQYVFWQSWFLQNNKRKQRFQGETYLQFFLFY